MPKLAFFLFCLLLVPAGHALKLREFKELCANVGQAAPCSEHPVVQAYVGGALDMVAAVDDEASLNYYCRDPREFFDVAKIVDFMLEVEEVGAEQNAMLAVIAYLKKFGECT